MTTAIQLLNVASGRTNAVVNGSPSSSPTAASFEVENIQHLSPQEALQYQQLLGHGATLGRWETPQKLAPVLSRAERAIDIADRIMVRLPEALLTHPRFQQTMDEAVLYLSRWALLCRVGPVGFGPHAYGRSLDASTIAQKLYQYLPMIFARSIERRLAGHTQNLTGFVGLLIPEDLRDLYRNSFTKYELDRMGRLKTAGLWFDEPQQVQFHSITTQVKGPREEPQPKIQSEPYQPLPDWYIEQIGPRVLWLIKDLGPNLISLLHHLQVVQQEKRYKAMDSLGRSVKDYFAKNVWRDRDGKELEPPFALRLSRQGGGRRPDKLAHAWPPRDLADLMSLAGTLQRAHLFMALLLMAARHIEVLTLERDCVQIDVDGQARVQGKTYKATAILEGKDRRWPAPNILVYAFAQQRELVQVLEQLDALLVKTIARRAANFYSNAGDPTNGSTHLWSSIGYTGGADLAAALNKLAGILPDLARAVGLSDKPDDIKLHPHRLRKTMARLAGIAIDGSQKVLMQLLGHEDVTTTLYYIQSDPALQQEVLDVIRELRLLRMEESITSAHVSLHDPDSVPHGGLGGGGAAVLSQTIVKHEKWLHRQGKDWGAGDARELAVLLADNGRAARLIAPGVVCTKSTHERGMCNSRMGAITPGNCKVECHSHIELAAGRRDVQRVIPILVQHTTTSIENGEWLAAIHNRKQLMYEMSRFPDIGEEWQAKPEVQSLLAHDLEGGQ